MENKELPPQRLAHPIYKAPFTNTMKAKRLFLHSHFTGTDREKPLSQCNNNNSLATVKQTLLKRAYANNEKREAALLFIEPSTFSLIVPQKVQLL